MFIEIDDQQHTTILVALRFWQNYLQDSKDPAALAYDSMPDYFSEQPPLSPDKIDELCESINCDYVEKLPSEKPVRHYVAVITKGNYEYHGPFNTELEQHEEAVKIWNDKNQPVDVLIFLDVRGSANFCPVPENFLENPDEELARLKATASQEDELEIKIRRYIEYGGTSCPFCGSEGIEGDSYDHDEHGVEQDVKCLDCHKTWTDIYTLTNVRIEEEQHGSEDQQACP